jgi:putative molybdopterin biosynthesis protein
MDNELLTAQEVADILKIKKNTVYELVKRGELPSKKVGKQVRISTQDVNLYLNMPQNSTSFTQAVTPISTPQQNLEQAQSIVLCGQDFSLDIIANHINCQQGMPNILRSHAGSYNSLHSLYQGKVDIATSHLWDEETKTYNYPYISKLVPGIPLIVVRLFGRMIGYYVKKNNPKAIKGWADLKREDLTLINREKGSGTRVLIDEKLKAMSINRNTISGYHKEYTSHLSVASAIARGEGDFGLGSEQGCQQVNGIDFIPLQNEWYDMVFCADQKDTRGFSAILDFICSESFLMELSGIRGYDISQTGKLFKL